MKIFKTKTKLNEISCKSTKHKLYYDAKITDFCNCHIFMQEVNTERMSVVYLIKQIVKAQTIKLKRIKNDFKLNRS